jgi:N-acetyl-1-D-myo-inositol-2-amino-2-deoxy-alpha-D-glucopyranoside deacetylase
VHAHPDDESIGTGGTLARYAEEGIRTALVCCTRGEEGQILDPTLDPEEARPRLGAIRESELRAAAAILHISELHVLGYRDSGMDGTETNANPSNFINADAGEAAERLAAVIRALRPQVVVTYDERGGYGHPDHKMAHRITLASIERATRDGAGGRGWRVLKLYYTVIALDTLLQLNEQMKARGLPSPFDAENFSLDIRQFAVPDEAINARIGVSRYQQAVERALRAHRTQIRDDDILLKLPDDLKAQLFSVEHYIRAFSEVAVPQQETDLFAGLR